MVLMIPGRPQQRRPFVGRIIKDIDTASSCLDRVMSAVRQTLRGPREHINARGGGENLLVLHGLLRVK